MASGESNEDTEVYNITLSTGDELTLMGQAEILYAKTSREGHASTWSSNALASLTPSVSLAVERCPALSAWTIAPMRASACLSSARGRFSTCSPLELQMQEGEHTIRTIVEKTRLPVNVMVPSSPPRNPHDLHLIREGHRYKLVNIQTKTVVVCCALRSNKILPVHFPLHVSTALPRYWCLKGCFKEKLGWRLWSTAGLLTARSSSTLTTTLGRSVTCGWTGSRMARARKKVAQVEWEVGALSATAAEAMAAPHTCICQVL